MCEGEDLISDCGFLVWCLALKSPCKVRDQALVKGSARDETVDRELKENSGLELGVYNRSR